jgi:hypothetical protein
MQHIRMETVQGRRVSHDEAIVLRLIEPRPPTELEEWRRVLHQAADILEHLGWCRGTLERRQRHCAVGAIVAAYNKGEESRDGEDAFLRSPALQLIFGRVASLLGFTAGSDVHADLMGWNDCLASGRKEVISVLRAAAQY